MLPDLLGPVNTQLAYWRSVRSPSRHLLQVSHVPVWAGAVIVVADHGARIAFRRKAGKPYGESDLLGLAP